MTSPRVAFIGSPDFAVASLQALMLAGVEVVAVVTQPDKPAGRGNALKAPAVKVFAEAHGLPLLQPSKVRDGTLAAWLRSHSPELVVVAAYGRILGDDVLHLTPLGCVNVHASLLPRWRGASPITRCIAAGDSHSGLCLMQMDAGLDTGPVLARTSVPIADDDTTTTLEAKLAAAGAQLLVESLPQIVAGHLKPVPQPSEGVTLAPPLDKAEGQIDWTRDARKVHAHIRAMQPWPGATTVPPEVHAEVWKVFHEGLALGTDRGEPGQIVRIERDAVWVATGDGSIRLTAMQRPGRKPMSAGDVVRGMRWTVGARVG